jgi:ammonium transporter, Amt family
MEEVVLNTGDTAWMMISVGLVTLMIPGLALFYGGMVRVKSVLNMMMMSFGALAVVFTLWIIYGFSMVFGDSVGGKGLIGNVSDFLFLNGLDNSTALIGTIPAVVFIAFQGIFAAITVALISGAIADRAKFGAWMVFAGIWATLVYFPVAHWVFAFDDFVAVTGGWIANDLGAIDFAGGTAVHINAGAAGLALAIVLGKRIGFKKTPMKPHNLPLVMLGAALLWFGWFGFNAGSAVASNGTAGLALLNTIGATVAAVLAWLLVEKIRDGHATSLGAASGVVAGLVAITPACASVSASGALLIGAVAGAICALSVGLKFRFGFDDSLDVVAVHLVGGVIGTLMIGLVGVDVGLFNGGGIDQLNKQAVGVVAVLAYSFTLSLLIAKVIDIAIGFRISESDEISGIDLAVHAERGYELSDNTQGSVFGAAKGA